MNRRVSTGLVRRDRIAYFAHVSFYVEGDRTNAVMLELLTEPMKRRPDCGCYIDDPDCLYYGKITP